MAELVFWISRRDRTTRYLQRHYRPHVSPTTILKILLRHSVGRVSLNKCQPGPKPVLAGRPVSGLSSAASAAFLKAFLLLSISRFDSFYCPPSESLFTPYSVPQRSVICPRISQSSGKNLCLMPSSRISTGRPFSDFDPKPIVR